jgi:hypothetical protein
LFQQVSGRGERRGCRDEVKVKEVGPRYRVSIITLPQNSKDRPKAVFMSRAFGQP